MQCVQGLLNYQPNGPKDGGLIVMKGSSKLFDQFFSETREQDDHEDKPPESEGFRDLFIFKEEDVKWFEKRGCEMIKVNLEPGDLVLWDSRTMHYACFPEGDLIRHVQYVCMTPARFAKKEDMDLKAELFRTWQGTTHWPHCNIRKAGVPIRDGKEDPHNRTEPLEKPEITQQVLRLAGVEAY
jgi:ectoine hydroxylase-related dioxygenase (phytanoyl-CoA dioxygenase family)